ncbi:MAG: hypothetical protein ACI4E1_00655, partial [Lachnospira sp.]
MSKRYNKYIKTVVVFMGGPHYGMKNIPVNECKNNLNHIEWRDKMSDKIGTDEYGEILIYQTDDGDTNIEVK